MASAVAGTDIISSSKAHRFFESLLFLMKDPDTYVIRSRNAVSHTNNEKMRYNWSGWQSPYFFLICQWRSSCSGVGNTGCSIARTGRNRSAEVIWISQVHTVVIICIFGYLDLILVWFYMPIYLLHCYIGKFFRVYILVFKRVTGTHLFYRQPLLRYARFFSNGETNDIYKYCHR